MKLEFKLNTERKNGKSMNTWRLNIVPLKNHNGSTIKSKKKSKNISRQSKNKNTI